MLWLPRSQQARRGVTILAGAIDPDHQGGVGGRKTMFDAQANLLEDFLFLP